MGGAAAAEALRRPSCTGTHRLARSGCISMIWCLLPIFGYQELCRDKVADTRAMVVGLCDKGCRRVDCIHGPCRHFHQRPGRGYRGGRDLGKGSGRSRRRAQSGHYSSPILIGEGLAPAPMRSIFFLSDIPPFAARCHHLTPGRHFPLGCCLTGLGTITHYVAFCDVISTITSRNFSLRVIITFTTNGNFCEKLRKK